MTLVVFHFSSCILLSYGPFWLIYLERLFITYGTSASDDNSSNVIAQILMPTVRLTAILPKLPSSKTHLPSHPGSKIDAVECTTIPSLPNDDLPSNLPIKLFGIFTRSSVTAKTKSPGCITKFSPLLTTTSRVISLV